MDPENEAEKSRDVEMTTSQTVNTDGSSEPSATGFPRAMSVDVPDSNPSGDGSAHSPSKQSDCDFRLE